MKKTLLPLLFMLTFAVAFAQAPQGINYQGVARDGSGNAISNHVISVKLVLHQGSSGGAVVFSEVHTPLVTDTFGLYSLIIGSANQTQFNSINWSAGNFWLEIDIDPNGSGYNFVSSSQLMSVPFALYAGNSGSGTVTSLTGSGGIVASPSTITTTGTFSLAPSGATAGTYGSSTQIPVITIDAMGRVTGVATQTVATGVTSITATGGITGTSTNNSYTLTVNNTSPQWNAAAIQNTPVNITGLTSGQVLQYNGTSWVNANPPPPLPSSSGGEILYSNSGAWSASNTSNLFFNGTMLGVGNNTPVASLDVKSATSNPAILATSTGAGPAIMSNGPLRLAGVLSDFGNTPGSSGDILMSQGSTTGPKWVPFSALSPWLTSATGIFPATTTLNVGIGTGSPTYQLDVVNTSTMATAVHVLNNGSGYGIDIQNNFSGASSPGLHIFQAGTGPAAYISGRNTSNTADVLYVETKGPGNAIKGYSDTMANAIIGYHHGSKPGTAGVYGYSDNMGSAGIFHISNTANSTAALDVMTTGSGFSGTFSGGAGLQTDKLRITGGATANYVLTSDATGNATWLPPPGGVASVTAISPLTSSGGTNPVITLSPSGVTAGSYGSATTVPTYTVDNFGRITNAANVAINGTLPAGSNGQILYNNGSAWTPSNVTSFIYNGTSVGINNSSPGAALDAVSTTTATAIKATNVSGGIAVYSNGPLRLGSHIMDAVANAGASGDVLVSQSAGVAPKWMNPSTITAAGGAWLTTGNTGSAGNFLGTTNAFDLIFKTNGSERMRIDPTGLVSIGTGTASTGPTLEVSSSGAAPTIRSINTGTVGSAGNFSINNTANTTDAVFASTNGSGAAVNASNTGGGVGVKSVVTGNSNAGYFQVNSAANTNPALFTITNGSGSALMAQATGSGFSGDFAGGTGLRTDGLTAHVVQAPNGTYTVAPTDFFIFIPAGVTVTLNLPPATSAMGKIYIIKNMGSGSSTNVSYNSTSGTLVNTIPPGTVLHLISDGTNWQAW